MGRSYSLLGVLLVGTYCLILGCSFGVLLHIFYLNCDSKIAQVGGEMVGDVGMINDNESLFSTQMFNTSNLRYFSSQEELADWLAKDNTNQIRYVPVSFDCDDFAYTLQKNAREDGYILEFSVVDVWGGESYITGTSQYHAVILAIIPNENAIYEIDPQNDNMNQIVVID